MKFTKTTVTNLLKGENGTYYLRVRVSGKLIWRSLETTTFSVAKLRLADKVAELRSAVGAAHAESDVSPKTTFSEAMELYKAEIKAHPRLKPRAKEFRLRSELTLRRTWPSIFDMELRRITPEACKVWLARFENGGSKFVPPRAVKARRGNSPTTVNAVIAFLRHVFDVGVKAGLIYRNPGKALMRKSPTKKLLRLPNRTQFAKVVAHIRVQAGWGPAASNLVEGLAYSGMRIGEARKVCWEHIDFEKGLLTIPGEKTESAPRIVPMTPAFRTLVEKMRGTAAPANDAPVFRMQTALGSLATACQVVGVSHMTHHDLRHLFATTCIEAGVDIPTVSLWLGHADGGALAMQTYGHIRPEHSAEAAKKVSFAPPAK
ncbi:MAG TPA: site-specific integrase [Opitutaceae bacterium]|jgi:integrase|nr:site-specific integrase [Opitutaceae bacterium]